MPDDLSRDLPLPGRDGSKRPSRVKRDQEVRQLVDREVPLGQQRERVLPATVHAWLDGELPEAAVRSGATSGDVDFWLDLTKRVERSRLVRTPENVEAQIMAAIPHHVPQLITPWWRREFVVTPLAAVSVAAALMALAAAAAMLIIAP